MAKNKAANSYDAEEMTVEVELEGGQNVTCEVITIFTVDRKDYIALLPVDENGENDDGEVWLYRYEEDSRDTNAEPTLIYIEDDDEYDRVADAFDEYLDSAEFDELMEQENKSFGG